MRRAVLIFAVVLTASFAYATQAANTIYRCEKDGQITLTDRPCNGAKSDANSSTTTPSTTTPSTVGVWKGQLQYSGTEAGEMIVAAHTVVPLTLEFTADGKVSGAEPR